MTTSLRLHPGYQARLPRRTRQQGLSSDNRATTIMLADQALVRRGRSMELAVQPDVIDAAGERDQRARLEAEYMAGGVFASRLPGGLVDTSSFLLCPSEGQYLVDSVRFLGALPRSGFALAGDGVLEYDGRSIIDRDERVVAVGGQSSRNYYHWMLESLARVLLYRQLDDGSVHYLTPQLADWQWETLQMVGVSPERVIEVKPRGFARFREVIAVSRGLAGIHEPVPTAVAALAGLAERSSASRRIYVSRENATVRKITNAPEVRDLLSRYGFENVSCESLSVREQIELFSGAEAVLGVHGAGLANIVFSRPGTRVIELSPEGTDPTGNAIYPTLAALSEQSLLQVVCALEPTSASIPASHRDIHVDTGHLEGLLRKTLRPSRVLR